MIAAVCTVGVTVISASPTWLSAAGGGNRVCPLGVFVFAEQSVASRGQAQDVTTIAKGRTVKRQSSPRLAGNGAPSTWPPRPFQSSASRSGKSALAAPPAGGANPGPLRGGLLQMAWSISVALLLRALFSPQWQPCGPARVGDWSVQIAGDARPVTPPGTQPSRFQHRDLSL